jgi:hypothetical protein
MEELLLNLEHKIRSLIDQQDGLKQAKFKLAQDKQSLLSKQQKAVDQIKTLVAKLKTIEECPE